MPAGYTDIALVKLVGSHTRNTGVVITIGHNVKLSTLLRRGRWYCEHNLLVEINIQALHDVDNLADSNNVVNAGVVSFGIQ